MGDPENDVTTHRAVDKTRVSHTQTRSPRGAARAVKSRGRKCQDRTQAGQKVQRLAKTTHQCRTPGRRRDVHNSGVRPRHTDRRVRKAGQWRARRRASKPLGQRSASESVKRRSSDSGQRSHVGCREAQGLRRALWNKPCQAEAWPNVFFCCFVFFLFFFNKG